MMFFAIFLRGGLAWFKCRKQQSSPKSRPGEQKPRLVREDDSRPARVAPGRGSVPETRNESLRQGNGPRDWYCKIPAFVKETGFGRGHRRPRTSQRKRKSQSRVPRRKPVVLGHKFVMRSLQMMGYASLFPLHSAHFLVHLSFPSLSVDSLTRNPDARWSTPFYTRRLGLSPRTPRQTGTRHAQSNDAVELLLEWWPDRRWLSREL